MEYNEENDKELIRMRNLVKSFNNKQEVYKEGRNEVNEKEIAEDTARMRKNLKAEEVNEDFYRQGSNAGMHSMNTVNSVIEKEGMIGKMGVKLRPDEALSIALFRTLESGAPVNNLGFYDEINWHLSNLGFTAKQPIDIKTEILKMIKN